jgi:hypothetical protein
VIALAFLKLNFKREQTVMKILLFICFLIVFGWLGSGSSRKKISSIPNNISSINIKDTINFSTQIQLIMIKNCSPCHFPGGKMYERLPFDKDTTIINHETGILKRIKGDENALIKAFVQQHK